MPDIFLSYTREDQAVARVFAKAFAAHGLDVWWDQQLKSGEAYDEVTEGALRSAKAVVVLWSKKSAASRWVRSEATVGQHHGVLMPCMIEACHRPVMFELTQTADLSHWDGDPQDKAWLAFLADVQQVVAKAPADGSPRRRASGLPGWLATITRRRALALAAAVLLIAGAGVGFRLLAPHASAAARVPRLAVLRLESLGDTEPYFSEGVADELIAEASRIQGMEVTGRASSFALTGDRATPANAARELGATLVLTGSVRKLPDRVRVNAELVEAPGGRSLWSQTFEKPASDVFLLERDIAVRVAQAADARVTAPPPQKVDPEAYRLYLQGREQQLGTATENWSGVRDLYRSAVDRDPTFAAAWASLARAEANVASEALNIGNGAFTDAGLAPALDAAARAIALNDTLAEPYLVRTLADSWLGHWKLAAEAAAQAEKRGGSAGGFYRALGYMQKAEDARRRSTALDPLSATEWNNYAYACEYNAHAECQLQAAQRAHELGPKDTTATRGLIRALIANNRSDDAYKLMENEGWLNGPSQGTRNLLGLAGRGAPPTTAELLASLKTGHGYVDSALGFIADAGRWDDAAALLDKWGPDSRSTIFILFRVQWTPLRAKPQFWALMEREGLAQYWRESGQWPDFCAHEPVCEAHKAS